MLDARTLSLLILSFGEMSNKKLQKMCYYLYSIYLATYEKKIANIEFEAWVHGPVSRDIYNLYKGHGWNNIPQYKGFLMVPTQVQDFAEHVWAKYGKYTADQLEEMSHNESPWKNARQGLNPYESSDRIISDYDIASYFANIHI